MTSATSGDDWRRHDKHRAEARAEAWETAHHKEWKRAETAEERLRRVGELTLFMEPESHESPPVKLIERLIDIRAICRGREP